MPPPLRAIRTVFGDAPADDVGRSADQRIERRALVFIRQTYGNRVLVEVNGTVQLEQSYVVVVAVQLRTEIVRIVRTELS